MTMMLMMLIRATMALKKSSLKGWDYNINLLTTERQLVAESLSVVD